MFRSLLFLPLVTTIVVNSQSLSDTVVPVDYKLSFDLSNLTTSSAYNGTVNVTLNVITSTSEIVLHAVNLSVEEDLVVVQKQSPYKGWITIERNIILDEGLVRISFPTSLAAGTYQVYLPFQGFFRNDSTGLAKVGYHINGTQRFLGLTRLGRSHARTVFPCVDDIVPRVKFTVKVLVNDKQIVKSNVNYTILTKSNTTLKEYLFDTYPEMPVYQLALAVLEEEDFTDNVTSLSGNTIDVHTSVIQPYGTRTNFTHIAWSKEITGLLIEAASNYFQTPYNFPKIEQLIVPGSESTTTNWGFVTFPNEAFLVTTTNSGKMVTPTRTRHEVALGLARSVVQQWCGGFISMDSWENVWVMEGLAEYLMYPISASVTNMSSWELNEHAVIELMQMALAMDSGNYKNDSTINPLSELPGGGATSYYKGGALFQMLVNIFDRNPIPQLLEYYFKDRTNAVTKPTMLWDSLYGLIQDLQYSGLPNGQNIASLMTEWTASGYSVLRVSRNTTHFIISQNSSSNLHVPVTYLLQGADKTLKAWLTPNTSLDIPTTKASWIALNINQTGYYRVLYEPSVWEPLVNDYRLLPPLSRAQLLDDMFSLALNGSASVKKLLQFTTQLRSEVNYFPWHTALRHFQELLDKIYGHASYNPLKSFVLDQLTAVIDDVGMVPKHEDSHTDKLKRVLVLEKACTLGHDGCLQKAVSYLESWRAKSYYDADLNMGLLCAAVSNSSGEMWTVILKTYHSSEVPSVKVSILKALACTKNVSVLTTFLDDITSANSTSLSPKSKEIFLNTLASTSFGANVLFDWLTERLSAEVEDPVTTTPFPSTTQQNQNNSSGQAVTNSRRFNMVTEPVKPVPLADQDIATILSYISTKLTSNSQGFKLEGLTASLNSTGPHSSLISLLQQTTAQIYSQYNWARHLSDEVTAWFADAVTNPPDTATTSGTSQITATTTLAPKANGTGRATYSSILVYVITITLVLINTLKL